MDSAEALFFQYSQDLLCREEGGYFRQISPSWQRTLGWSIDELISRPYLEFVHPEDRERTRMAAEGLLKGLSVRSFENRYRTKDGLYRTLQWSAVNHPNGEVFAIARDITEQKCRKTRLTDADEASFFQFLVENTQDPVYLISPADRFRICYVNQAACAHFGKTREELLKMSVPDWDPNFSWEMLDNIWAEIRGRRARVIETVHRVWNGKEVPVQVTVNYIQFSGREYIGGVIQDISIRKRREKELEHFARAVSHDLQEPLRTISSYLTLLKRNTQISSEQSEYFDFVTGAATRMQQIIRGLLSYAQLGEGAVERYPISLQEALKVTLLNLQSKIAETAAEITYGDLPVVMGDPLILSQIFQNLIDNALKYRREAPVRIHIDASSTPKGWLISVKDNGIGIDEKYSEQIFGMFRRLHGRDEYSGLGLGLATCKKLIELMGGQIWVESKENQGSTFYFLIPEVQDHAAQQAADATHG